MWLLLIYTGHFSTHIRYSVNKRLSSDQDHFRFHHFNSVLFPNICSCSVWCVCIVSIDSVVAIYSSNFSITIIIISILLIDCCIVNICNISCCCNNSMLLYLPCDLFCIWIRFRCWWLSALYFFIFALLSIYIYRFFSSTSMKCHVSGIVCIVYLCMYLWSAYDDTPQINEWMRGKKRHQEQQHYLV